MIIHLVSPTFVVDKLSTSELNMSYENTLLPDEIEINKKLDNAIKNA